MLLTYAAQWPELIVAQYGIDENAKEKTKYYTRKSANESMGDPPLLKVNPQDTIFRRHEIAANYHECI